MSSEVVVLVGAGAILVVAMISGKLSRLWLTEPMVATALGIGVGSLLAVPVSLESPTVLLFLELTLALVLFTDASRIDLRRLRNGYSWPLRMLAIGVPAAILFGALVAGWILSLPLGLALLVGVILAPTDAALAAPVLEDEVVPRRVRQALNIESGLNDGLAVPALLIAIGLIDMEQGGSAGETLLLVLAQLGIGVIGGVVLGFLGARSIGRGAESGWMNPLHQKIAAVALAIAGFSAVQMLGGSGFVATFIAGGLMSHLVSHRGAYLYQFAEAEGDSLVLIAFFVFGAGPGIELVRSGFPIEALIVAVFSIVVLRPAAIAISLTGQRLMGRTIAFLGWFGPRGLATVVFVLVALDELGGLPPVVVDTVTVTVLASIAAHGLSAVPMSRWLAGAVAGMPEDMAEMGDAYEHPMRRG